MSPDSEGNIRGISVPRVPWHGEDSREKEIQQREARDFADLCPTCGNTPPTCPECPVLDTDDTLG
jgi:hypothetical protein